MDSKQSQKFVRSFFARAKDFKCGGAKGLQPLDGPVEYGNVFERETTSGQDRLVIGADKDWVQLLIDLSSDFQPPFGLLFILSAPRATKLDGRFDVVNLERKDVVRFCKRFRRFLERDARHSFWISSMKGPFVVLDRHNQIFLYGDLDRAEAILRGKGFAVGEVRVPFPHSHQFSRRYDGDEAKVMNCFNWRRTDLQVSDDE